MTRVLQALAAGLLMLCLSQFALAQSSAQKTAPRGPAAAKPIAAAAQPARSPDLAYGAFQRGYFLTAFSLATDRVTNATDP
ncbi:MAG TPA: hypothetical protein VF866_00005, partial [Xanthobacteraceae bacterium]